MRKLGFATFVGVFVMLASQSAFANNTKQAEKNFCAVADFVSQNKAFVNTRSAITYSLTLFGATLSALVNIEAQRAKLAKGLDASRVSLKALSWAGPLKAFGRAAIPLMDNSAKVIKAAALDSTVSKLYTKVYSPLSYTWMAVNYSLYGVQVAGVAVCGKANIMGVKVTKSGSKEAAAKFWALAQKSSKALKQSVTVLHETKRILSPFTSTFKGIKTALKPLKSPLAKIEKGLKLTNTAMKPVFVAAKALVKEMNKRRCIAYSVKVKVKVKVKKGKFWKTKVKVKTKTKKFCFRISKVAGKIQKLAAAVQKPVNDLINKVIKPLMKKVEKGLKKALNVGGLKRHQKRLASLGSKLGTLKAKLDGVKNKLSGGKVALERMSRELQ